MKGDGRRGEGGAGVKKGEREPIDKIIPRFFLPGRLAEKLSFDERARIRDRYPYTSKIGDGK